MLVAVVAAGTGGQQPAQGRSLHTAQRKRETAGLGAGRIAAQAGPTLSAPPHAAGRGPMINDGEGCNQIVVPLAPSHD